MPTFEFPSNMDASTKFGALMLAQCIVDYWRQRGYFVKAERYQVPGSEVWGVRSNLLNGIPKAKL